MVCFPDRSFGPIPRRIFPILAGILAVFFLSSCRRIDVQVLADPYVEQIHGGNWAPLSAEFRFRARIRGYSVRSEVLDDRETDPATAVLPETDIVILSPYLATVFRDRPDVERRYIVAGGKIIPGFEGAEGLFSDRSDAMAQLGELAGTEPNSEVFALFNVQTPEDGRELAAFLDAFNAVSEDPGRLVLVNLAEESEAAFSPEIEEKMLQADLAVLLAGPVNLTALVAGDATGIPVMTERAVGSGIRSDRVIASIEDNRRTLMEALLEQLGNKDGSQIRTYPATVYRKKWFDAILPSNL